MMITTNKMYYPEIGGVESAAKTIAEFGLQLYGQSMVITFNTNNTKTEETINGVHVIRLPVWFRRDPIRLSKEYAKILYEYDSDKTVWFFHFPNVQNELFFYNHNLKGRKICLYHSDIDGWGIIGEFYNSVVVPRFLNKMDTIITTSPNLASSSMYLKNRKPSILPLYVDTELFKPEPKRQEFLREHKLPDNAKIVLYVGRYGRYKGLNYLLEAFRMLPDNYYLVLIGGEPSDKYDTDRVLQLGPIPHEQLPYYYNACDVFVLPSIDRGEAFGLVGLEALACDVPIITTELGTGTSYYNIDGVTGRVIPPRNVTELMYAILEITQHRDKFYGQRERALQFTKEKFLKRLEGILNENQK